MAFWEAQVIGVAALILPFLPFLGILSRFQSLLKKLH